ncbi:hypothetical protein [Streptomyces sp.]|uniref:hypothetical protein n=1 Tax=Streptomyces sp. TaxID=1931 RepID=UPI002811D9FE|nr:hypothetical protein [Streptomyces sp.]
MNRTEPHGAAASPLPEADAGAVRAAVVRLEAAALRLRSVLGAPVTAADGVPERAWRAALDEELCDRLIDLAAARAWAARETAGPADRDPAATVLRGCALWAVEADTTRVLALTAPATAGLLPAGAVPASGGATGGAASATVGAADGAVPVTGGAASATVGAADGAVPVTGGAASAEQAVAVVAQRHVAALVTALASAEVYDAVCAGLRAALGPCPRGRAAAAWEIADAALSGLGATREEWVGADPACTAAGGWVLVDRIGRLALAAALLAAGPAHRAEEAETRVNAARRHTWNHLRQPPPEAATAVHVRRTAELVDWITGSAGRSGA